jgi:predicted PhzF superfamily epimerase YddE/YHI9
MVLASTTLFAVDVFVVDAFADGPYTGNPAGVVLLTEARQASWMQRVAAEMGYSETAFVSLIAPGPAGSPLPLRWFTPTTEVDLCGHATVAAAHVLGGDLRFDTRSGVLGADTGTDGSIRLDFPADPPEPIAEPAELAEALPGVRVTAVAQGRFDLLVETDDPGALHALAPDLDAIARIPTRGVAVTARGDGGAPGAPDFTSRFFAPNAGVDEDPVTGSAHCMLACWWSTKLGRTMLRGYQASARGGTVGVAVHEDRVTLSGRAVTTLSGRLHH